MMALTQTPRDLQLYVAQTPGSEVRNIKYTFKIHVLINLD